MENSNNKNYTHNSDHPKMPPVEPVVELFAIAMILFLNLSISIFNKEEEKILHLSLPNFDNGPSFTQYTPALIQFQIYITRLTTSFSFNDN